MPHTDDNASLVRRLASHAALPLQEDRLLPVGELLTAWVGDANRLSAKMASPRYAGLTPITGFLQASIHGEVSNDQ